MYAGVDFDTRAVHIVSILEDEPRPRYNRYELEGYDAFERTRDVRVKMPSRSWWEDHGCIAVGIEEPQGAQRATVAKLKAIQGAVVACIPRDLVVEPIVPTKWRKELGIKGNATKEDVEFWCRFSSPFALEFSGHTYPQDFFDALCLALVVQKLAVVS